MKEKFFFLDLGDFDTEFQDERLSTKKVLDFGCAHGNILFHLIFITNNNDINYTGINKISNKDIDNFYDNFWFEDYNNNLIIDEKGDYYDYYTKVCCQILKTPPLEKNEFEKHIRSKLIFNKNIYDFVLSNQNYYDLIILSKILHYEDIDPVKVISRCLSLLTEEGRIYVKTPKRSVSDRKKEINVKILKEWFRKANAKYDFYNTELDDMYYIVLKNYS